MKNGVTFVPMRVVIENLNADVDYLPANDETPAYVSVYNYLAEERVREVKTDKAEIKLFESSIKFYDGDPNGYIGYAAIISGDMNKEEINSLTKETYPLLAAPYIKDNRMMVPLLIKSVENCT